MHKFYIAGVLLPITPSSLKISINDKDEEIDLANGGTMSVLNQPGLTTYSFEFRVPNVKYPFAMYDGEYMEAPAFISLLSNIKMSQKPFTFKVIRGDEYVDYRDISTIVSLVEYSISEDAENGGDYIISVEFKEYVKFATYKEINNSSQDFIIFDKTTDRDVEYKEVIQYVYDTNFYTVLEGDTFHGISQKVFGTRNYAEAIAKLNDREYTTEILSYVGAVLNVEEESVKKWATQLDNEKSEKQQKELMDAEYGEEIPGMGYQVGTVGVAGAIKEGRFWKTYFPWLVG